MLNKNQYTASKMTDTWQTVNSNKRGGNGSATAFGSAGAFGSATAFGNGAFGGRRTTAVSPLAVAASAASAATTGAYVPPGKRVHVETFDEAFPQLGGVAVPGCKAPVANSDKPLLSDMVAELALKEAVEKEIAATKKRRAESNKEVLGGLRLPSLSDHMRKVALRKAEKERREFQEGMELLASKYTLFRCELNHLYKPNEEYFEEQEEEEDYAEDYESSDGGAGDDEEY